MIESHTNLTMLALGSSKKSHRWQVASPLLVGFAECLLGSRRLYLWLTQKPQKAQTLRVAAPSLPSGMYTLGETPTAVSDSDAAHSVKVCEVCVRQKISEKGTANAPDG